MYTYFVKNVILYNFSLVSTSNYIKINLKRPKTDLENKCIHCSKINPNYFSNYRYLICFDTISLSSHAIAPLHFNPTPLKWVESYCLIIFQWYASFIRGKLHFYLLIYILYIPATDALLDNLVNTNAAPTHQKNKNKCFNIG